MTNSDDLDLFGLQLLTQAAHDRDFAERLLTDMLAELAGLDDDEAAPSLGVKVPAEGMGLSVGEMRRRLRKALGEIASWESAMTENDARER
jgi:hypothetical protein